MMPNTKIVPVGLSVLGVSMPVIGVTAGPVPPALTVMVFLLPVWGGRPGSR